MFIKNYAGRISALLLLSSVLFFSCSHSEPKIDYGFIELVYYPAGGAGGGAPVERFSFFVLPQDDDGIENLGELYLYHDREGLVWKLEEADWVRFEADGKIWIGSRAIAMPDGGRLPRGKFRAVLVNKGGDKIERAITFDGPEDARYSFPFFSLTGGSYRIDSQYPVNRFICYDAEGAEIQVVDIPYPEGVFYNLAVSNNARSVALWAEDREGRTSAFTEAVPVR